MSLVNENPKTNILQEYYNKESTKYLVKLVDMLKPNADWDEKLKIEVAISSYVNSLIREENNN